MGGVGSGRTFPNALERASAMRDAYLAGQTLQDIASTYSVTRERVRQIITKYFGRLAPVGGRSKQAEQTKIERRAQKDADAQRRFGCTFAQYRLLSIISNREIRGGTSYNQAPVGAFLMQRKNAAQRGIAWEIGLWDWWMIWQKSGKWSRRGRTATSFVMCRHGDVGPYAGGNVFIAPAYVNGHDKSKSGLPAGVIAVKSGRFRAHRHIGGKTVYLGTYDTPEAAHLAYLKSLSLQEAA
jgi:hypothetical protein